MYVNITFGQQHGQVHVETYLHTKHVRGILRSTVDHTFIQKGESCLQYHSFTAMHAVC